MKIPMILATNDNNGQPTGFVDSLEVPDLITIEGVSVPCELIDDHHLKLGIITLPIYGYTTWVGNICWDCCYINSRDLHLIIHNLRDEYGWSCVEAERSVYQTFKSGQYIPARRLERIYEDRLNWFDRLFQLWLDFSEWWLQSSAISKYLRQELHRRQSRRWLRANDDTALVARLLFELNRDLRQFKFSSRRNDIYRLKSLLIEYFYKHGLCRSVSLQKQELECWSCNGSGEYMGLEDCRKCSGTGVYRTHWLYQFVFTIGQRIYIWHQPKDLVKFQVSLVWMGGRYSETKDDSAGGLNNRIRDLYLIAIVEYLKSRGVDGLAAAVETWSFRQAVRSDLWDLWRKLLRRPGLLLLRDRFKQLRVFFETGRWETEDEIPF